MTRNRTGWWMLGGAAALLPTLFLLVPPIAQDPAYHLFADRRTIWGVANFWNVVSNLPFALVRLLGLWKLRSAADRILFSGVLATCFGSAYYPLAPSDSRLVWDRLPAIAAYMIYVWRRAVASNTGMVAATL